MRFSFYRHPQAFVFWPALIYTEARCSDPNCRVVHGFSVELSFLWWSLCFDTLPLHDEEGDQP